MVKITDEAVAALNDVMNSQENKEQHLRIYIAGMGCSGIAFGLSLDDEISENDSTEEISGIKIVYDVDMKKTVEPLIINYIDDGFRKGFTVEDPNAVQCGGSCSGCH
ncbi:MAG: iron-sulfur cluster assembly accessory protein [Methanosarcinaceae archaeon]|nr:iron-sulfur cluster assembly accessory protein [Methanosarcinaceae archaeon]